jgi:hypothetical protein
MSEQPPSVDATLIERERTPFELPKPDTEPLIGPTRLHTSWRGGEFVSHDRSGRLIERGVIERR